MITEENKLRIELESREKNHDRRARIEMEEKRFKLEEADKQARFQLEETKIKFVLRWKRRIRKLAWRWKRRKKKARLKMEENDKKAAYDLKLKKCQRKRRSNHGRERERTRQRPVKGAVSSC